MWVHCVKRDIRDRGRHMKAGRHRELSERREVGESAMMRR